MVFPDNLGARKVPSASGAKRIWRDRAIPGGVKLDKVFTLATPCIWGQIIWGLWSKVQ
jgi:hypothetical protein